MLKIKLAVTAIFVGITGFIFAGAYHFPTAAKGDVTEEIAGYKNWKQVQKPKTDDPAKAEAAEVISTSPGG